MSDAPVCITCSDLAVPMRVVGPGDEPGLAECAGDDGRRASVETGLLDGVAVGDVVLVHAGVALQRVEAEVAA